MSSFRNANKSQRRTYKERAQPAHRKQLGLLEKHKDYVLRARDYHRKQEQIKTLQEKARNRNPDEFYHKMINSSMESGRHMQRASKKLTKTVDHKLMVTQDINYVQMKLNIERKKVERLESEQLHLTKQNTRLIFVSSDDEEETSNEIAQPSQHQLLTEQDVESNYKELEQRRWRAKELQRVADKMKIQKQLMGKGKYKKCKAGGYKWKKERNK